MKSNYLTIDLSIPLLAKGPKFLSHIVVINGNIAYLKPTISAMMFCIVYVVVGLFLIGLASFLLVSTRQIDLVIFLVGFGVAIATFGITLIQPFLRIASFDKERGVFKNRRDRQVKLCNIMSLQINEKKIQPKHALSYWCYELNLLTKGGRRINVLNHNNREQLFHDANVLSQFLKVSLHNYCQSETDESQP
ncbi:MULTISPECIES: hypothetical protein [unclassified Vibrio]|uniref:Uncharacterized protein n=1 Tax=Vibrio sp. HB236076 TaxID=3232307 RepID=A0AB39HCD8_9VIBR|nr:hypothetical protein [Vibrio sp. HB161653]MDP5254764.1 hypothetical protein [Vibrio sp. HB161653]